ncbi:MAG: glutathione S-transferase family protein [Nannocystaceae bacterium]|jgi:glutathione S-transferase
MLRFYGSPMSSSGRTHWMLEECDVEYESIVTNPRDGGTRAEAFLQLNPLGTVPFIIDGEIRLAESIAINMYLAERYKPALLGATVAERALIWQWSLWGITNLQPPTLQVLAHRHMLPEGQRRPEIADEAAARAESLLAKLEGCLRGEFLVGQRFTAADINCGSVVNLAARVGLGADKPRVVAWLERLRERPAYQVAAKG